MGGIQNKDHTINLIPIFPLKGKDSWDTIKTSDDFVELFTRLYPKEAKQMPDLKQQFERITKSGRFISCECYPWHMGNFSIIGDAANCVLPTNGLGTNASLMDCLLLDDLVGKHQGNWDKIMDEFQTICKPNAIAL